MKKILINKPQQQRSKEKFNAILRACPIVLDEFGFRKTTVAKIALEADVSTSTVYDYFSNKEAVLIAYLDEQLKKGLVEVAYDAKHSSQDALTTLKNFIGAGLDFAQQQSNIIKVIMTELPTQLDQINLAGSREKILQISKDFAASQRLSIANKDTSLMIYSLTNIVLGFQLRTALARDDSFTQEAVVEELTQIVSQYMGIKE